MGSDPKAVGLVFRIRLKPSLRARDHDPWRAALLGRYGHDNVVHVVSGPFARVDGKAIEDEGAGPGSNLVDMFVRGPVSLTGAAVVAIGPRGIRTLLICSMYVLQLTNFDRPSPI